MKKGKEGEKKREDKDTEEYRWWAFSGNKGETSPLRRLIIKKNTQIKATREEQEREMLILEEGDKRLRGRARQRGNKENRNLGT